MKSNGNSFGNSSYNGADGSGSNAATPLITTGRPPQPDHWWYLVNGGG